MGLQFSLGWDGTQLCVPIVHSQRQFMSSSRPIAAVPSDMEVFVHRVQYVINLWRFVQNGCHN